MGNKKVFMDNIEKLKELKKSMDKDTVVKEAFGMLDVMKNPLPKTSQDALNNLINTLESYKEEKQ